MTEARETLLAAVIGELGRGGLSDRSLRDIAAAVGSSHRMLIHHFGSREGLLTAVVASVEQEQRRIMLQLPTEHAGEAMGEMWRHISSPELWPHERLFFECYARALQGEKPFAGLLPGLIDSWVEPVAALEERRGFSPQRARARARLGLALVRGLLLDLLATQDRSGVDASFEEFVALARSSESRESS